MSKHTPGPWERFRAQRKARPNLWTIAAAEPTEHEKSLCTEEGDIPEGETIVDGEMTEANARLIAAAPDLLEALMGLTHQCLHPNFDNEEVWRKRIEAAEAAIAKAEGISEKE